MADVQIQDVVKTYEGDVTAVRGISLHIQDGEFLVLVGPSGCGKSTTLRMVAGLEDITDGTISIGGRVVNHVAPKDRDIAMVFQNYALYPHMTVYKNMAFGLKLRKFPKVEIDKRVRDAAKILGITELLERRPKALSGGQRQRVALGRAIVRDPSVFLFDEPLSNLDAKLRVETRAELKRLHKRLSTTTIYVTHDQEEAMTLGDRVTVMSGGHIQQCDTPLMVYRQPVNRFVAAFLGTPPMNFLDGQIVLDDGVPVFQGEAGRVVLDGHHGEVAKRHVGQDLVLGIRPEGLELHQTAEANRADMAIDGELDVVEPLGNMMDMFVSVAGGKRLVARVKAEVIEEGTAVKLFLDADKMHLFEAGEYGANLTLRDAGAAVPA